MEQLERPERVRLVTPAEEEAVMEVCRLLHGENGIFPMNEDKVRGMLRKAFNKEGGILAAVGDPGKIEGLIFMLVSTFWYSDAPHWEELFLFVKPEYRRNGAAAALMDFAKWCSTQSFPLLIGVISNERTEGKVRLYQRQFSKPAGCFFLYGARTASMQH